MLFSAAGPSQDESLSIGRLREAPTFHDAALVDVAMDRSMVTALEFAGTLTPDNSISAHLL